MKKVFSWFASLLCMTLLLTGAADAADSVPKPVLNASESAVRIAAEYADGSTYTLYRK